MIKTAIAFLAALFLIVTVPFTLNAQEIWTYDFGEETGSHTSGESESFLPATQDDGGNTRVRIGTGGGSIELTDPGDPDLGTFSQARMVAASTSSANYIQIFEYENATQVFYTKFTFKLSSGNSGQFTFVQGSGSSFSGNSAFGFSSSDTFTGLRWTFEPDGTITTERRTTGSWSDAGGIDEAFDKDQIYTVEIYGNNSTSPGSYFRNGEEFTVGTDRWVLWIDGVLFDEVVTGALDDEVNIDSFMFGGFSSVDNVAVIEIDDIVYSNSLPDLRTIEGEDGWRMLASPMDGLDVEQLSRQNMVQGVTGGSFPGFSTSNVLLFNGVDYDDPTNTESTFNRGEGFLWYLFDNAAVVESKPLPLDFVAAKNQPAGNVTVNLTSTGDGWNLLGNPFNIDLDISNIGNWVDGGSLESTQAQVWNPAADGAQGDWVFPDNDVITAFQGFFIQNNDATSINYEEIEGTNGTFYKSNDEQAIIAFKSELMDPVLNKTFTDQTFRLYFSNQSSHDWDLKDATKLQSLNENYIGLAFVGQRNGEQVLKAQESRPINLTESISIPVRFFSSGVQGDVNLSIDQFENVPETWTIEIEDKKNGEIQLLNDDNSFVFSVTEPMMKKSPTTNLGFNPPVTASVETPPEEPRFVIHLNVEVQDELSDLPSEINLHQNYPNPFNPTTVISYELPQTSDVQLAVYDMLGRQISTLANGTMQAGTHQVTFNAATLSSGVYIYKLQAGSTMMTRKLTVMK